MARCPPRITNQHRVCSWRPARRWNGGDGFTCPCTVQPFRPHPVPCSDGEGHQRFQIDLARAVGFEQHRAALPSRRRFSTVRSETPKRAAMVAAVLPASARPRNAST